MTINNIILVGITGVGKTTIGRLLAEKLNKQFIDLDKYIEQLCGVDIPTIFELEGEVGFRNRESYALAKIINEQNDYVLSLGGGCVIRAENRQYIQNEAHFAIQLMADINILVERLAKSPNKRPLLVQQDLYTRVKNLLNERQEWYNQVSHLSLNTSKMKPQQVVEQIYQILYQV
ncbi:MAG: hypothetical protein RLZZ293_663 [Pseudomonadota bacterium]|jgi:shikimate kinase